ncbi:MAG TPA: glucuronyl hydrolase [Chloroflexi bacterium]|nr:glucuronyl hydrolase [Chloroflexota bacterium]
MTETWIEKALNYSLARIRQNLTELDGFPERTENARWICVERTGEQPGWWVGGHWVGQIWLAFAHTQSPDLERSARTWAAYLVPRQFDTTTHDLGFLFELSHVLGYQLTGDEIFIAPALQAAASLSQRFNPRGGYFQAWGPLDAPAELCGRAIVDTMMNLDLLFWVSQQIGDPKFAQMAETHARTVMQYQIRPDFSTAHVIDFDPQSGAFLKQDTHQGWSGLSCWSRGQAWAVYGFGDCYRATGDSVFLETARHLANYALDHLPVDRVPYWDYDSPEIPNEVRDSSAASILASALLNLAALETDPEQASCWRSQAESMLKSLWENYSSRGTTEPSILIRGTRSKPHGLMDHGLIYGDYYFVEALLKLRSITASSDEPNEH